MRALSEVIYVKKMEKEEIIRMLSFRRPIEIQKKGIKNALLQKDLHFLLFYAEDMEYSENCAKIFTSLNYSEVKIYLDDLFDWIEDLNTPSAIVIFDYLINCPGSILYNSFHKALLTSLKRKSKQMYDNLLLLFKQNIELQTILKKNDVELYQMLIN